MLKQKTAESWIKKMTELTVRTSQQKCRYKLLLVAFKR